jgi:small-conductance mechanosensitive channel
LSGRLEGLEVKRPLGYLSFLFAVVLAVAAALVGQFTPFPDLVAGAQLNTLVVKGLSALAIGFGAYGSYLLVTRTLVDRTADKRRRHDVRNVVRFLFVAAALVAVLGVLTDQWVGVLFSLGVVGFAVTFALQQPLFSLIGWFYIMVKRPYQVGDRVSIEGSKGDVVTVDFFVTTLWETGGELITSNQPSGRVITLPNSVVLSSHVYNFSTGSFPYVWNELSLQVAYETDLAFARGLMVEEATDYLGEEMAERTATYRQRLAATAIEMDVADGPTVNIRQGESWVDLRLRYLVHPRQATRVRNDLYERIFAAFNDHPERVMFPIGRNR